MEEEKTIKIADGQIKGLANLFLFSSVAIKKTKDFVADDNFHFMDVGLTKSQQEPRNGIRLFIDEDVYNTILFPVQDELITFPENLQIYRLFLLKEIKSQDLKAKIVKKTVSVLEFLAVIWSILCEQRNGERGFFVTDGFPNTFFVKTKGGNIVHVGIHRLNECWELYLADEEIDYVWSYNSCIFVSDIF